MEFLAILIAVGVLQLRGNGAPLQADGWFYTLRGLLHGRMSDGMRRIMLILLPALVVVLLQMVVNARLYGLPELVFFIIVLVYSLGRHNLVSELETYLQRWERGDFHAAYRQLATDPSIDMADDASVTDPFALHRLGRRLLYYRGFERLFPVLFWFFFLGPAGAIAYRAAVLEHDAAQAEGCQPQESWPLHWLEWLPARVCGLLFALVGDFDKGLYGWQRVAGSAGTGTADVLEVCGNAALGIGDPGVGEGVNELVARGTRELQSVMALAGRALVAWLAIMGMLAMIF